MVQIVDESACCRAARSAVFLKKMQNGGRRFAGHSDLLKVTAEAAARLQRQSCCDTMASSEFPYLDELHISAVVYKSMPTKETF